MTADARVSAAAIEAEHVGAPAAEVSGLAAEAVNPGVPAAEVSGLAAEAINPGAPAGELGAAWVEANNIGAPAADITVIGVEVWRTIRDAPFPIFPSRLFAPPALNVRTIEGAVVGAADASGQQAIEALAAGGRWQFDFAETPLIPRDQVLAWRALAGAADWGATSVIVPLWERLFQPLSPVSYTGPDPFGLEVWGDPFAWSPDQVEAAITEISQRGATELRFSFAGPVRPQAGQHFSILGRHWGWRLYRIARIVEDVGGEVLAEVRPPLREWAKAGELLNFDSPRCTCRIAGPMDLMLEHLRLGRGAVSFVETHARTP